MKYFIVLISLIFLTACATSKQEKGVTSVANPAAVKCIKDGYELHPIKQNGIEVSSICLNKQNEKKCKSWKYYRGECSLL